MNEAVEHLQQIGFTRYEAQAYLALLRMNPLNGYELAKASGIPRSNVYPVLQKLEERGVVLRIDSSESARYIPINPKELLFRLRKKHDQTLASAENALSQAAVKKDIEYVLNARGYSVLLDHAHAVISSAQHRLLIGLWPEEAKILSAAVQVAERRGVQIMTLCLRGCPHDCQDCQGTIYRYALGSSTEARWLLLVSDDTEILAGEITLRQEAHAVRTRQKMLVDLTTGYLRNSVALAILLSNLPDGFDSLIGTQTKDALHALNSFPAQATALDALHQILDQKKISNEPPITNQRGNHEHSQ